MHGDQLHGAQEENFIIPLDECCGNLPIANGSNCTNINCRNTRSTNQIANKIRRRSTDPVSNQYSNFNLSAATNSTAANNTGLSGKDLLANSLLSNSLMNSLMNNLTNHLVNSGIIGTNLGTNNLSSLNLSAGLLNSTSISADSLNETEDNVDMDTQTNSSTNNNSLTTCNGTAAVSLSSNSIGKC